MDMSEFPLGGRLDGGRYEIVEHYLGGGADQLWFAHRTGDPSVRYLVSTTINNGLDLATEGPAFMREAYSHEVISHGFWPGGPPLLEPTFYAYAVPEPAGFKSAPVRPDAAFYHGALGEFVLPYDAMRRAEDPERALRAFVDSTYQSAATLAGWDRAALERETSDSRVQN